MGYMGKIRVHVWRFGRGAQARGEICRIIPKRFVDFALSRKISNGTDSPLKRFAQRFTYNGLDQIALRDLGFGARQQAPPPHFQPALAPPIGQVVAPLPPQAVAPTAQIPTPPQVKRPLPEDPRQNRPPSPIYKRQRAQSPQGRKFTPPTNDRVPNAPIPVPPRGFRDRNSRDRSPQPMPGGYRPPVPPASIPAPPPSQGYGAYSTPPPVHPPASTGYGGSSYGPDRSGLSRPLVQFIGSLPSARSFDGTSVILLVAVLIS